MTDSIDKHGQPTSEAKKAYLDALPNRAMEDREDITDLPTWVRLAAVQHDVLGLTWVECAERAGKSPSTLGKYKRAPAMKDWRSRLQDASEDPAFMAEATLKASALGITLEYLLAYQGLIDAGAFSEVARVSQDLLDRIGITKKQAKREAPPSLHITIAGGQGGELIVPTVEADWEEVEREDGRPDG